MNLQEAVAQWRADYHQWARLGLTVPGVQRYMPDEWKHNIELAMDALPVLSTDPSAAVPALLTTSIDPEITRILFTPNRAAEIFTERRIGTWTDQTRLFPVVEASGEVASYGDYNVLGRAGVNVDWPNRQSYRFQLIKEYGDLELEVAGLAKLNWVSEIDQAATRRIQKFSNFTYFFGVANLQNYGLLNDPNLPASITPATKAVGGTAWVNASGVTVATANEIFTDLQSLYYQLVNQTNGLVKADTKMVLALSPNSEVALTQTNSFNVNVHDLIKKNWKNIRIESATQYGQTSSTNSEGLAGGNLVQLIAEDVEGQNTGYCAYNERMRSFPVWRGLSSYQQKVAAGTWGAVVKVPAMIAQMLGV